MPEPLEDLSQLVLAGDLAQEIIEVTLRSYGFPRPLWADEILQDLADRPPLRGQFAEILPRLIEALSRSPDPEMGLLNFARFAESATSKATFFSTLVLDPALVEVATVLFSTSQYFSDILIRDIRYFDWIRLAASTGSAEDRERMISELSAEVRSLSDHEHRLASLRRFKRREMLRIGFADIVGGYPLETVTADLSNLADAELESAYCMCLSKLKQELGTPRGPSGEEAELSVIAMGKLGGRELNYSSDIDLIYIYSAEGEVEPSPAAKRRDLPNQYFFNRLAEEITRCMSQVTDAGFVFRVDTRLRPDGRNGPLTRSLASCLHYYGNTARQWELQALLKARSAAGSPSVGQHFVRSVEPLVYRKYLSYEQIQETKELKKRIERKAAREGVGETGVKTGIGGIRDIEFIVQFHQLLFGGQHPELRTANTLEGLDALGDMQVLTSAQAASLELAYRFLRETEHRLMTLHQFKTHSLPTEIDELDRLGMRMGFQRHEESSPGELFQREYQHQTRTVREVFDTVFGRLFESDEPEEHPEVDLLLSPESAEGQIDPIFTSFGFKDPKRSFRLLNNLAEEDSPFLKTPSTRKYLANLTPSLLRELRATPDPDAALTNLDRVATSLGAKTMLYHWLSEEKEALPLLLEICSAGEFLVNILGTNPGMFDDLVDSLATVPLRNLAALERELRGLLSGAREPLAILNSFRNVELLRIGTSDRLGRSETLDTTHCLSNLAETVLRCVVEICRDRSVERFGQPLDAQGTPLPFTILALGKFGGQELNYFSDLDVIFVYGGEGQTAKGLHAGDFFTRLAQSIFKMLGESSRYGRLFDIDARLRPQGSKGPFACSLSFLERYYLGGTASTWERQALTKLRYVAGSAELGEEVVQSLHDWAYRSPLSRAELDEILDMRRRLEESVEPHNLKRGSGGIVDVEFVLQILRLAHGDRCPELRTPNEMEALRIIESAGLLPPDTCRRLHDNYVFLRRLENRLRMASNRSTDELPQNTQALNEVAYSMGLGKSGGEALRERSDQVRRECRAIFEQVTGDLRQGGP